LQKFDFEIDEIAQRQNEKAEKDHYQKFPGWVFYLFSFHCCLALRFGLIFFPIRQDGASG